MMIIITIILKDETDIIQQGCYSGLNNTARFYNISSDTPLDTTEKYHNNNNNNIIIFFVFLIILINKIVVFVMIFIVIIEKDKSNKKSTKLFFHSPDVSTDASGL